MKLSDWQNPPTKPTIPGIYNTNYTSINAEGYSYWDGKQWYLQATGLGEKGKEEALKYYKENFISAYPNKKWRGIIDD